MPHVSVPANIAISIAALLLDIGVAPERCGFAIGVLMPPVFLASALEAAHTDGERLNQWPSELVHFVGTPARRIGTEERAVIPVALQRAAPERER